MSGITSNITSAPFAQRHAPITFADLVFADPHVEQRLSLYAQGHLHNSLILHGPFGTAKSVTAQIIVNERRARAGATGPYIHVYSGAALDSRFQMLVNSVSLMLSTEPDPRPYVVIDEADQLSRPNQLQLRHLLSTMADLRVIMTTNSISAVDGGVQSRCDCLQILPATPGDWLRRAEIILAREGVTVPRNSLTRLLGTTNDVRAMLRNIEALVLQSRMSGSQLGQPISAAPLTVVPGNAQVTGAATSSFSLSGLTVLPTLPGSPTGPHTP